MQKENNSQADKELLGIDIFLRASKNRTYRRNILESFAFLMSFLQKNNLTTHALPLRPEDISPNFVLRKSDLTDEGYQFYTAVEQKFFKAIDRAPCSPRIKVLDRQLAKMRSK